MADLQNDPSKVTALYPDPPPFWKDFTPENLTRFDSLKQEFAEQQGVDVSTVVRIPDIPDDLIYLQPPVEPVEARWKLYSEPQSVSTTSTPIVQSLYPANIILLPLLQLDHELQSLETAGIQRLAAASETELAGRHMDRAFELKRLAKSMLLNFLELVGLMGHNASHVSSPSHHPPSSSIYIYIYT